MNNLDVCKVLGYAVVTGSVIYTATAFLTNSQVQQIVLRILTSSPVTGAGYGLLSCGFVGALIGYSKGDDGTLRFALNRGQKAIIGGTIGAVGGAFSGAILLTTYNHTSINIV